MFPGAKISDKICVMGLHKSLVNSIPNIWNKPAYVQGFYFGSITFKADVKMCEVMEKA